MRPIKIISGGQNGADLAGLEAAKLLEIKTGGTAPKGWRVQDWQGNNISNPSLAEFGLVESDESEYPPRTIQNVKDSDGTVWFGYEHSPGGKLTINTATQLSKQIIINPNHKELAYWVNRHKVNILNVSGNRVSQYNPYIFEITFGTIVAAFTVGIKFWGW